MITRRNVFLALGLGTVLSLLGLVAFLQALQNRAATPSANGTPAAATTTVPVANVNRGTPQPGQPTAASAAKTGGQQPQGHAQGGNSPPDDRVVVNDSAPVQIKPALIAFRMIPRVSAKRESPYQCTVYQTEQGVLSLKAQSLTVHVDPGAYVEEHICTSAFKRDSDTEQLKGQWRSLKLLPVEDGRPTAKIARGSDYEAQKGDTEGLVAYRAGIPIQWLMMANGETSQPEADSIKPGTKFKIPETQPQGTVPVAPYGWEYDKPTLPAGAGIGEPASKTAPGPQAAPKSSNPASKTAPAPKATSGFVIPPPP